ncbi:MAG: valine--tRNA ligase [Patescibacteria group bacterium]
MPQELSKSYEPQNVEGRIYKAWEQSGVFAPNLNATKSPYSIILPPPNANGSLHMGHALYAIQDLLVRRKRMQGHPTLWLPGTDHAGIETQTEFEKQLKKDGKSRFDLGPDEFYKQTLEFTMKSQGVMLNQLRLLGFSLDWSKEKFTLDPDVISIVHDTFKKLHTQGLIYRANRVVNYSVVQQTSLADIEVKFIEKDGFMYTLNYGTVRIATTRPETIFADAAIAVNPEDERFTELIGKTATIPLVGRQIPIIADNHVDPKLGTGALKVTPAHDFNDYEIGLRHNLPQLSVIDLQGKMINVPEELLGLKPAAAREKTVEMLEAAGFLVEKKPIKHMVGHAERTGEVIEPLLTPQWFLKVKPLSSRAKETIEKGQITILPEHFVKPCLDWFENMYDWCISRQIWWGIRIPVFYRTNDDTSKEEYLISENEEEARAYFGDGNYRSGTDTFDTWFSSSQWPYITLKTNNLFDQFYPTSVMETGYDILYKWVARMIMMGLWQTDKIPFETVYLHGLVNDKTGRKMSKSKGNVVNPVDLISQFGADAVRFSLLYQVTGGQDQRVADDTLKMSRTFMNKIWNASRFVLMKVDDYEAENLEFVAVSDADREMKVKYDEFVIEYNKQLEQYRFGQAAETIYHFFWHQFCDVYVEKTKEQIPFPMPDNFDESMVKQTRDNLLWMLRNLLVLLHPYIPFITEEIYQILPIKNKKQFIMVEDWVE